jgi:hypothetical protein
MQALAKAATTYGDADAVNKLVSSGGAHAWPAVGTGSLRLPVGQCVVTKGGYCCSRAFPCHPDAVCCLQTLWASRIWRRHLPSNARCAQDAAPVLPAGWFSAPAADCCPEMPSANQSLAVVDAVVAYVKFLNMYPVQHVCAVSCAAATA